MGCDRYRPDLTGLDPKNVYFYIDFRVSKPSHEHSLHFFTLSAPLTSSPVFPDSPSIEDKEKIVKKGTDRKKDIEFYYYRFLVQLEHRNFS